MRLPRKTYFKICDMCGKQFYATRAHAAVCGKTCESRKYQHKQIRLSRKLKPEQTDVLLSLQDYFLHKV